MENVSTVAVVLSSIALAVAGALGILLKVMGSAYGSIIKNLQEHNVMLAAQNIAQQEQITRLQHDTATIWDFQMRRAQVEVMINRRKLDSDAPVLVGKSKMTATANPSDCIDEPPPHVKVILSDIASSLKSIYESFPPGTPDRDIMLAIEDKHGKWIADQLCSVHNFSHGECLIYALSIARSK